MEFTEKTFVVDNGEIVEGVLICNLCVNNLVFVNGNPILTVNIFDSKKDAKDFLIEETEFNITNCKKCIDYDRKKIKEFQEDIEELEQELKEYQEKLDAARNL